MKYVNFLLAVSRFIGVLPCDSSFRSTFSGTIARSLILLALVCVEPACRYLQSFVYNVFRKKIDYLRILRSSANISDNVVVVVHAFVLMLTDFNYAISSVIKNGQGFENGKGITIIAMCFGGLFLHLCYASALIFFLEIPSYSLLVVSAGDFYCDAAFYSMNIVLITCLEICKEKIIYWRTRLKRNPLLAVKEVADVIATCKVINSKFSLQLLISIFQFFLQILLFCYLIIKYWLVSQPENELYLRIALFTLRFGPFLVILTLCDSVYSEIDSFHTELFKLMRKSPILCYNDKLHLFLTMKQNVQFTACGFFNLGCSLVTSLIAAATTYLVILVQFSTNN